ncbi:Protein CBG05377 [Caenorhabditis briggsae]|uniref:Uncharacterized protein n=2 Tax=Caenorhabditis briggsae TaxID=6238 RepID=A0AAE9JGR2_CAEBR|nr:Protein CBG05377 [Caenorhabditis briggsae]UMM28032.1 hypothetical protein L5515_011052 [Caenorhabditis briggsae]CAP25867.1 Protein CBG05377 [Caenorhabditis briggsae]
MADKSAYMSAGGYSSGYMGSNASSSGYACEDYASGGSGASNNNNQGGSGGNTNPGAQVFKARTDQSCYLGPLSFIGMKPKPPPADRRVLYQKCVLLFLI